MSIGFNAMNLPLYQAVTVIALSYRFKCISHTGWSSGCPFVGKWNFFFIFFSNLPTFQMVIIVSRISHISYKWVSTWKCVPQTQFIFLMGEINFEFLGGISKMWHFAFADPRASMGPSSEWFAWKAVAHCILNYHWKFRRIWRKTSKVIECLNGRLSTLNRMEIFIVILIKVWVVQGLPQ